MSLINDIPSYVSVAAFGGTALLVPLYVSQRRDVARLRALKEADPAHPGRDLAASEALLDRAESALEEVLIETGQLQAAAPASTDPGRMTPIPPSERLGTGTAPVLPASRAATSGRPALEQVTTERAALAPHPAWRRFAARVGQPRVLAVLALIAMLGGVGALFASGRLLGGNEPSQTAPKPGVVPAASIDVAVLNGTSIPGLAGRVGDDVQRSGFTLDGEAVTSSRKQYDQTIVMFSPPQQQAATRVAKALGVTPVQPIDSQTRALAPNAAVVVIAGLDRAKP